ncbi:MAG: zinc finger domain-containing protein [Pseudonocardiales bacterium]
MSSGPEPVVPSDADDVERHPCPRCLVEPGSPCRSRSGAVATTYHTGRFTKVARLAKLLRVPLPAARTSPRNCSTNSTPWPRTASRATRSLVLRAVLTHHVLFAWNRLGISAQQQHLLAVAASKAVFHQELAPPPGLACGPAVPTRLGCA